MGEGFVSRTSDRVAVRARCAVVKDPAPIASRPLAKGCWGWRLPVGMKGCISLGVKARPKRPYSADAGPLSAT